MKTTIVCVFSIIGIACSTSGIRNNSQDHGDSRTGVPDTVALVDSLSIGLVAHFPFDGSAIDVSGSGFNATVHGAFKVADRFGNPSSAFEFNSSQDYIETGDILDNIFCAPVAKFSVTGWARARSTGFGSTGSGFMIGKNGDVATGPFQWSVSFVDGKVCGRVFFDTQGGNSAIVKSPMQTHVWFHFALVFDGSLPPTQRLSLYVNGQVNAANALQTAGVVGTTTMKSRVPLTIGRCSSVSNTQNPGGFFNGALDDIRIYNRPLSPAEVKALYHEGGYNPAPIPTVTLGTFIPARYARQVSPTTTISATFNAAIDASTFTNETVCVNGSVSGRHRCLFKYDADTKTLNATPKLPFHIGEVVTVTLTRGIKGVLGDPLTRSYYWAFTVRTNSNPGSYHLSQTISVETGSPQSVAALDVDGNGTIDLAVVKFNPGTVTIWKNDGQGAFSRSSTVSVGDGPNFIIAADLDGDGMQDLAVTNIRSNSVSVLRNDGTGKFTSSAVAVGSGPMAVAASDFDGDGALDLAVANSMGNSVSILMNDGHGRFTTGSTIDVGSLASSVVAADMNNDGFPDLVVCNSNISGISVHLNTGDGTFSAGKRTNIGDHSWRIAAADVNGDGYIDLAVANSYSNTVSILLSTPIRVFVAGGTLKTDAPADLISAVDVNGDGYVDLAVGSNTLNRITIWRNSRSGSFTADTAIAVGKFPTSLIAADFDGDGKIDFAVTNGNSNSVSIISSGAMAPAVQSPKQAVPVAQMLELNMRFTSPSGNRVLYAGEVGRVALDITNTSESTAKKVTAKVSWMPRSNEIRLDSVLVIGDIPANKTVKTGFSVEVSPNVRTLLLTSTVQIVADEGVPGPKKDMTVAVRSRDFVDNAAPTIILRSPTSILSAALRGMKNVDVSTTITVKSSNVPIEGTARDASGIAAVTINGKEAYLKSNGELAQFVGNVVLTPGDNPIEIVAIDNFRNQESMKLIVHREADSAALSRNYALLFAIGNYDSWPPLVNPEPDAQAISQELKKSYGFRTELLQNVTRDDILTTLRRYAGMKFGERDQLFIFFAGHGQFDPVLGDGYLVAKDSRLNDDIKTSYVAHSVLRTIVNNIPCRHIFLVVDACFGGTIDPLIAANSRGDDTYGEVSKAEFIQRKLQFKTRRFLTSGGKEYVPDGRPGEHSPFVRKFLEALRSYGGNDGVLTINEILQYEEKTTPQPRAGEFGNNEPGSDFVFIAH